MRCVKLFFALVYCAGFLNASSFTIELEDQTDLAPTMVPKIYVALTAEDQNFDTSLYLSSLPEESNRPVLNRNFTNLGVFLWMFEANNIHNAPFEDGLTARDLLRVSLQGVQNIKVVVTSQENSQFFLSLFINQVLTRGPRVSTTFPMEVDPNSLGTSGDIMSLS